MTKYLSFATHLSLVLSVGAPALGNAQPGDFVSPYINPQRDCLTEGMITPEGKNYRFLYSRDCRVVYVMPPAIMAQSIQAQGVNLQACKDVASRRQTIHNIESTADGLSARIRALEESLEKAKPSEEKVIEEKIRKTQERLNAYMANLEANRARFNQDFGGLPGAIFSVALDGDITANDLNELRAMNLANLNRRRTIIEKEKGPDGKENIKQYEVVDTSALRVAPMAQSYFSFLYNIPDKALSNGGIISSDIPGLQPLEQTGSNTGVLHIRASGGVTGKVIMSVTTACDQTKIEKGKPIFDESTNPFFTVNRTFMVQQMFAQGYEASLKVDKVIDQITKHTITHKNEGFQKSSIFLPSIKADVSEILDFAWTSEFDGGKNISVDKILEIKQSVASKLVDDYIERLVKEKMLTVQMDPKVEAANGGMVNETRTGHRCWTEKDGGLSGVLGRRHQVCGDFTYTVPVWRDGITQEEIRRKFDLKVTETDSMLVNMTTPFYYTTSFIKK